MPDFLLNPDFMVGWAIIAVIYAVFALGLNVHWGFTGLFNIGIAGFFALGAYSAALLTSRAPRLDQFEDYKWSADLPSQLQGVPLLGDIDIWFVAGLVGAGVVCGIAALIIGTITLRLRDDYLAIATLGIAESVRLVFLNEKWLGNGSKGLYRIPKFLGDTVAPQNYDFLYLGVVAAVLILLYLGVERVVRAPWGRVLRAIREDETTAAASGKDVFIFKLQSFILGAVIMGVGGGLFAYNVRFIDPPTFDPLLATFVIWAMLMVGGSGNNRGAILGAFVVWAIWSWSQFLPGFLSDPNFRFLMIGVLIVLAILIRPAGIMPERRRTLRASPTAAQTLPRINRVGQLLWQRLRNPRVF